MRREQEEGQRTRFNAISGHFLKRKWRTPWLLEKIHTFSSYSESAVTSISSSTMCTLPSDPFVEPFYSLKKAFRGLLPPTPQSADCANINIARPSSAPPILMTPSSTILAANIAMPASKMLLNFSVPKWTLTLIESNFQVIRFMPPLSARNKLCLSPLVWIHSNLYLLLLIILI